MTNTTPHELRMQLLNNGFEPLPLCGKACYIKGWSTETITEEFLEKYRRSADYKNTGIRCGNVVAVDVDVDGKAAGEEIEDIVREVTGANGWVRWGRGNRFLLLFWTNDPSPKRRTRKYDYRTFDLQGVAVITNETYQVEILGTGNQFCAYGTHPDTGKAYDWGYENPQALATGELPSITPEQLDAIIEKVEALFESYEWLTVIENGQHGGESSAEYVLTDEVEIPLATGGTSTVLEVEDLLRRTGKGMESLTCGLTTWRPDSVSGAGLARLDHKNELCVVDFPAGVTYYRVQASTEDLGAALKEALPEQTETFFTAAEGADDLVSKCIYVAADISVRYLNDPTRMFTLKGFAGLYPKGVANKWMERGECMKAAYAELRPDLGPGLVADGVGRSVLNLYEAPIHPDQQISNEEAASFREFMAHLVPDSVERELVIDWMATKVQKPWIRMHGLVMVAAGVFGTGRGTLMDLLGRLLGEQYCTETSLAHLSGSTSQAQYNDYLSQSLLVTVPEAYDASAYGRGKWAARKAAYEQLKLVVDTGTRRVLVRRKRVANVSETVYASIFIATNHKSALAIEEDDRRLIVVANGVVPLSRVAGDLAGRVRAFVDSPDCVGWLYRSLQRRTVAYDPFAEPLMTDAKRLMIESGKSGVDMAWQLFMSEAPGDLCSLYQWRVFAENARVAYGLEWPDAHQIDRALKAVIELYAVRVDSTNSLRQVKIEGVKVRPWIIRNIDKWKDVWDSSRMREELAKNGPVGGEIKAL